MKIFFKVTLIVLMLVVAGAIGLTTYQFNLYTPRAITQQVIPDNLIYFQDSYMECRKNFLDQAYQIKGRYKGVQILSLKAESRVDPELTIDCCYVPAQTSCKRLLILTSGVHGIEGYAGSAIQQMVLKEIAGQIGLDDLGLLFIHGMNPYGFKYKRRVTENNVDLNRNSSTDKHLYESVNKGYQDLNGFLNPKQKVNLTSFGHFFFQVNAVQKILDHSMSTLRQAVLQGQYQYDNGIYYGGNELEPSVKEVTPVIQKVAEPYEMVFMIDLHTGYGANGSLHFFPNPIKDEKKKAKIETIFSGFTIDWGNMDDFYTVTGDFVTYVGDSLPEKYYLPMMFEFGTLDTQTTMGAIKALHNVIIENQGVQQGYKSKKDEEGVKSRFLEAYYPLSDAWRSKVIHTARQALLQTIKKYKETRI